MAGVDARTVSVILFDGFELLDVFGPVEMLHLAPGVTIDYAGPAAGPVASSQGCRVVAGCGYEDLVEPDIVLVPGGGGTRRLVDDVRFLGRLAEIGRRARLVVSVCTGSALLAAAGLLDGRRATSNKRSFAWASGFGSSVTWEPRARWVHDGDRWTSSGVAAGMDMTAALIGELYGAAQMRAIAERIEYEPRTDPARDPFARLHSPQ